MESLRLAQPICASKHGVTTSAAPDLGTLQIVALLNVETEGQDSYVMASGVLKRGNEGAILHTAVGLSNGA